LNHADRIDSSVPSAANEPPADILPHLDGSDEERRGSAELHGSDSEVTQLGTAHLVAESWWRTRSLETSEAAAGEPDSGLEYQFLTSLNILDCLLHSVRQAENASVDLTFVSDYE